MQPSSLILTANNLSLERQSFYLWKNVNFTIHAGDVLEVYGENGSGKSTLLRVIAGLLTSYQGNICWHVANEFHYLGHTNGVKLNLTVGENIRLRANLLMKNISDLEIDNIVQQLGLRMQQQTMAFYLSAGQLRRLSLANLLIMKKALWILDEPTTSLDQEAINLVKTMLAEHRKNGGAAIIATHHPLIHSAETLRLGYAYA